MSIGRRIKEARDRAGLTQDTVAKALKVTKGAVFQWEKDLATPKSARLAELARFLDVEYEWLATGRGLEARSYVKDEAGSYSGLGDEERRLLLAFRGLPAAKQRALLELIES
ncbi:helix-turn-helix domain-containing protein [Natronospira bacteriovora]|uniref:Helix-turn-helix domain-containing protein n=1 Tax=Natronospira bacteriovora TaxID=3069753 RepID=A0ABU0W5U0_9GAMM|nr:helix-turn-helix domain-containing protein [Natronospira sp. AB-CW4]MDQ2069293.1 helix-turn-helix domain-containing protein [Natronospira sp. AB-CW4]